MEVIPVIDLAAGAVVHARMGERAAYRPIRTLLSATADPVDVVAGLLRLHPFRSLYVADLDAIQRAGDNFLALRRLKQAFPALSMWIDNGAADTRSIGEIAGSGLGAAVIGSESQQNADLISSLPHGFDVVLSLDFRGDAFQGPGELLQRSDLWPDRVIVMTLARVGSGAGPDFTRLARIRALAGGRRVYAAGGVRHAADLAELVKGGVAGALVATALHEGRLMGADLDAFCEPVGKFPE